MTPPQLRLAGRVVRAIGKSDRDLVNETLQQLVDSDLIDIAESLCARVFSTEQPPARVVSEGALAPFVELLLRELTWLANARVERGVAAHPCRGSICIERILRRLGPGDRSFGFSGDHPGSRRCLRRWEFIRVSLKVTETRD